MIRYEILKLISKTTVKDYERIKGEPRQSMIIFNSTFKKRKLTIYSRDQKEMTEDEEAEFGLLTMSEEIPHEENVVGEIDGRTKEVL